VGLGESKNKKNPCFFRRETNIREIGSPLPESVFSYVCPITKAGLSMIDEIIGFLVEFLVDVTINLNREDLLSRLRRQRMAHSDAWTVHAGGQTGRHKGRNVDTYDNTLV
jgi:hypothetical protein